MKVQVLVDNPNSWYVKYGKRLVQMLNNKNVEACLIFKHKDVEAGDILCLIACERKFSKLHLNKHNLVVHESALPQGKGFSPLTWQLLEGKNQIPITMFEASAVVDQGDIYAQDYLNFEGSELLPEIKHQQGIKTNEMILDFIDRYPTNGSKVQEGDESFYQKRTPEDSELDLKKTLGEQFNLLRVCDNDRYPAYFVRNGRKYIIKIQKDDNLVSDDE